jgi:AcrR family transcriptional regulator
MIRVTEHTRVQTRARLLESAAAAFARDGLDGANVNAISVAAGLAKGTVYNYFPSKEALFSAVVEDACRRAVADAGAADDAGAAGSTAERLRALAAADVAWAREHEPFARVLIGEVFSGDPQRYVRVAMAAAPFVGRVAEVLREGVARGEVRDGRAVEELALVFTGLGLMTLSQHWGSAGGWPALDEIPDLVVDLFLNGARPRGSGDVG